MGQPVHRSEPRQPLGSTVVAMGDYADPPDELVARLRPICLALPDTYEEKAWAGTRWMVRRKTFAHVLHVDRDSPPVLAKAHELTGAADVVTFRSQGEELEMLRHAGHPYFYADGGATSSAWCSTTTPTGTRWPSCSPRATA